MYDVRLPRALPWVVIFCPLGAKVRIPRLELIIVKYPLPGVPEGSCPVGEIIEKLLDIQYYRYRSRIITRRTLGNLCNE